MEFLYKLLESFHEKRQLNTLLLALLFLAFYPFYLLTSYMAEKGFYAYEIFSGVFGLVVPFVFMAFIFGILLLLLAFVFWGWVIVLIDALARSSASEADGTAAKPTDDAARSSAAVTGQLKEAAGVFVFNAFMLGIFGYTIYQNADIARPLWMAIVGSLVLAVILGIVQITSGPARMNLYLVVFVIGLFAPLFGREYTTPMIEGTLGQFRLGGVMVTIVGNGASPSEESVKTNDLYGRLVFLSSSNVYLETGCPRKSVIVPRKDSLRLEFAEIRTAGLKEFECPAPDKSSGNKM